MDGCAQEGIMAVWVACWRGLVCTHQGHVLGSRTAHRTTFTWLWQECDSCINTSVTSRLLLSPLPLLFTPSCLTLLFSVELHFKKRYGFEHFFFHPHLWHAFNLLVVCVYVKACVFVYVSVFVYVFLTQYKQSKA